MNLTDAEIRRRYAGSRTAVKEMAAEYGMSIWNIYYRMNRMGLKRRNRKDAKPDQSGEKCGKWKGGRCLARNGYIYINVGGRYRMEHRIVAERTLGRPLDRGEVVHHINGKKDDNRPENLEVMSLADHTRKHMTPEVARHKSALGKIARYGRKPALLAKLKGRK